MPTERTAQNAAITRLEAQGWEFSNWISSHIPEDEDAQTAVLVKHPTRYSTHYTEVDHDGVVS